MFLQLSPTKLPVELEYSTKEQMQELGNLLVRTFQMLSKMINPGNRET